MAIINASIDRDANFVTISTPLPFLVKKTMTFAGGTLNDPGDFDGTGNPATLFTVTGDVLLNVVPICKTDLVGAATLEVGVVGQTNGLFGPIANASTFVSPKSLWGGTVALIGGFDQTSGNDLPIIGGGQDIIQTIGTTDITAGVIYYYCFWRPLSSDGNVV